jgi:CRP-like cAMP-binding protein
MAKKAQVDVRKLKDEVAEHLKKSRWDNAADVLEQLVAAEPRDMAQRLKLGDTWRRIGQLQKAIESYQYVAKFFADEGQLIKAIGAVKIILEIDARNPKAQQQLADMNARRIGKTAASRKAPTPAAVAPPVLEEDAGHIELPADTGESLELDDGRVHSAAPPPAAAPPRTRARGAASIDLSRARVIAPPPPDSAGELDLDPDLPADEPELLPDEAILEPQPEDLAAAPHDDAVIPGDEFGREGGPIADLLSGSAEEEIELLSISADEEVAGARATEAPAVSADDEDLDRAFGNLAPEPGSAPHKLVSTKVPLFDDLSQDAFVALVNRLGYHRHAPGQLLLQEGDVGRSFFIIVEGRVRVFKSGPDDKEITLAHLGEGAFFGEMAMLSGAPRTASVVTEEDTELLEVTDNVLRELATKYPQVVTSLKNFYRQRLLNNVMAISPLFRDFDPSQRKSIVEKFRMRQAAPGELVIAEGKSTDGLYVVLHGAVKVTVGKREIARLKEGGVFGEMSLLTREPASASVAAETNVILLRLPRDSFQELVVTHPQILALVSELTDKRKSAIAAVTGGDDEGQGGMQLG